MSTPLLLPYSFDAWPCFWLFRLLHGVSSLSIETKKKERKRAAREGHGSWQPTSRSDFSCSKILSASYFRVGLSPPVIVGARIFQRGKRGMSFFVSSPTTRSSSSLFVAAQSFCHGRRNLKASGQIGDLLASADGWLLCQHPARPLANFRRLCVLLLNIYSALVIRRMLTADLHKMESIGRIVTFRPECIERLWVCVIGTAVCSTGLLLFDFFLFCKFFRLFFCCLRASRKRFHFIR